MVYEPLYHAQEILTIKLSSSCFLQSGAKEDLAKFLIVFNKTIIPFALVGYEIIISISVLRTSLALSSHIQRTLVE